MEIEPKLFTKEEIAGILKEVWMKQDFSNEFESFINRKFVSDLDEDFEAQLLMQELNESDEIAQDNGVQGPTFK